jgi:hypothetical protein
MMVVDDDMMMDGDVMMDGDDAYWQFIGNATTNMN